MMYDTHPTIGGDPEFFIYIDKKGKRKLVTADKVLPGKGKKADANRGQAFFDGVQAEINPNFNGCRETFAWNIQECLKYIYNVACKKFPKDKVIFAPLASVPITANDLKYADSECSRFGCSPDSNIYTEEKMEYPDGKKFMTRFSGGHIHLGFSDIKYMKVMKDANKLYNLIKAFDYIPGIMSVALSQGKEEESRRNYYGKAGTYRIQKHGIEYRTLSSYWLTSPFLTSLVTSLVRDAFTIVYNNKEDELLFSQKDENEIRNIIDTGNANKAIDVYKKVIIPAYDAIDIKKEVPMQLDYVRNLVDIMMKKGYTKLFNPYSMLNYWWIKAPWINDFPYSTTYGVRKFAKDVEHKFIKIDDVRKIGE